MSLGNVVVDSPLKEAILGIETRFNEGGLPPVIKGCLILDPEVSVLAVIGFDQLPQEGAQIFIASCIVGSWKRIDFISWPTPGPGSVHDPLPPDAFVLWYVH